MECPDTGMFFIFFSIFCEVILDEVNSETNELLSEIDFPLHCE